ncbi:hypothetical protein M6B38_181775 [Iris pallida]|uniref:Uncharacterized protein n=1 Tax=Iris pallida TaxID=29817 RepID=A0AAX6EMV6_IRIPA|nr:hypothetical protein M6B38_181775 [Iris pallida]
MSGSKMGFGLYLVTLWNKIGWTRTYGSGHGGFWGGHRHLDTEFVLVNVTQKHGTWFVY